MNQARHGRGEQPARGGEAALAGAGWARLLTLALAALALAACGDGGGKGDGQRDAPDTGPDADAPDADEPDVDAPDADDEPDADVMMEALDVGERLPDGVARAGIVRDEAALIGGVKADGKVGDVKIYNAHVAFIIEGARRATGGYRFWGGNVIDADVIRPEGEPGRDVFGEMGQSWNLGIFKPESLQVINNGADGRAAHVRLKGRNVPFDFAESFVRAFINPDPVELEITYDYFLEADDLALHHQVTVTNAAAQDALIDFPLTLSNQGDGVRRWQSNKGFSAGMGMVPLYTLSGHDLSYGWFALDTGLNVLFEYNNVELVHQEGFILEAGQSVTRNYRFTVTEGGPSALADIAASYTGVRDAVAATVEGTLAMPETADPARAFVAVHVDGRPWTFAPVGADGAFTLKLPVGTFTLQAFVRDHAPSQQVEVTLTEGQRGEVDLSIPTPGRVAVEVRNSQGNATPARVMLIVPEDDTTTPAPYPPANIRPDSEGEWTWTGPDSGGKISAVGMAADGRVELTVPAGNYIVTVSRGFTHEVDRQRVSVEPGQRVEVAATIDKVVDTDGWLSADFHIHALRSPDSDTPYEVRVLQALTEDLDIPVLTEHVTLSGLQPTVEAMGLRDQVIGPRAQEVTTFAYGHFNAFPLLFDPEKPNNGAVFPYDKDPAQLFEAIRNQTPDDEIIQVNHPRGIGFGAYFSHAEYNRETGLPDNPEGWSTNWDAIEVFNGGCSPLGRNEVLDDWIAMTNTGLIRTLGSGSDSHRENDVIGMPRNWIRVDEAALREDHQVLVEAVRARRMFVSCGPFVRFETLEGGVELGGMTTPDPEGTVTFRVEVQAPDWLTLDEVRLIKNGVPIDSLPIEITDSGVRLEATFSDQPEADAWYAVEVLGSGPTLPVHKNGPPYAFTNPIEVDADADGIWTPPGL